MYTWIILPLLLFFNHSSAIASPPSEWFLQPQELVRLKNSGLTETVIQFKVEKQQLLLNEKWSQAHLFQFVAKVIPSTDTARSIWSITSGSEMLLEFLDNGGYVSTKTRAEVVARQLNRALLLGNGEFTSIQRNGQSAVAFQGSGERLIIISVSEQDALFFESNANSIAQQWAAVLHHFWKSLPPVLLHPLPNALTMPDLVLLSKTGFADRILLSFFALRDIDRAVKAEQIKEIGFSKDVVQYLAKRITLDSPDRMRRWGYWGSDRGCGNSSISISTTISIGGSNGFHFGSQQHQSSSSSSRGSDAKGSHAGVPGKNSTTSHNNQ
jgi:hypothetical protein